MDLALQKLKNLFLPSSFSDSLSDVQRLVFLKAVGICTV